MPHSTTGAQDFVPYATAALDFHLALNVPGGPLAASRAELDSLHAHLVALVGLFDAHAGRSRRIAPIESDHLRAVRVRIWQAAEHLHAAYHSAPRPDTGNVPVPDECRAGLPEGAPELTICQRHLRAARLMRRSSTPTDLHAPFTGLIHH